MKERILAIYHLRADAERAREVAEDICIEQTAEAHRSLVKGRLFEEGILGRVEALVEIRPGRWEARISYPQQVTAWQIPQLLHVLWGNVSLKKGIRLEDIELPDEFLARFPGPRHGIEGLRCSTGVRGRPLVAAALKPMGLGAGEIARLAGALARGGIDIVKDDHGLADQPFCPFEERVRAVCEAVDEASVSTGRRTLYLPSITERADRFPEMVDHALEMGADGVLTSPWVMGPDWLRFLASRERPTPVLMAHPAISGAFFCHDDHGISPRVALGTLLRLAGADLVVFPGPGGRFPVADEGSRALVEALRGPLGSLAAAWPVPAGGIDITRTAGIIRRYGEDSVLLVGSSLMTSGPDPETSAARLLESVRAGSPEPPADG